MLNRLASEGPAPDRAAQMMLCGQFVGSWEGTVVVPLFGRLGSRDGLEHKTCRLRGFVSPRFKIEWYQDARGDAPVHRWLTEELSEGARELVGVAILEILQADGPDVCGTRFGRQLGDGVFEFRLDGDPQPWIDAARRSEFCPQEFCPMTYSLQAV